MQRAPLLQNKSAAGSSSIDPLVAADALADILAQVVAEKEKEFATAIALRDAEFKTFQAEMRHSLAGVIEALTKTVNEAIAKLQHGKDGAEGPPGAAGPAGAEGPQGKQGDIGPAGKDGKDGRDGVDAPPIDPETLGDVLANIVAEYFADNPVANGKDGAPGPAGAPGPEGPQGAPGAPGADGKPGIDGKDGLCGAAGAPGSEGPEGPAGRDGRDGLPGVPGAAGIAGKDGAPGRDGKDGAGFDEWKCEYDGQRAVTFSCGSGDRFKQFTFSIPVPIFQGKWSDENEYERGDEVSHGGNTYRALCSTTQKPGHSEHWIIATNRGRDGRDGKNGEPGPQGPEGRPGRDLTQLGQDGKKWG